MLIHTGVNSGIPVKPRMPSLWAVDCHLVAGFVGFLTHWWRGAQENSLEQGCKIPVAKILPSSGAERWWEGGSG